jgi:hypothetical protein
VSQLTTDLAAGTVRNVVVDNQTLAAKVTTADPAASTATGAGVSSTSGNGVSPAPSPSPSASSSTAAGSSAASATANAVYGVVFTDPTSFSQLLAKYKTTPVSGSVPTTSIPRSFVNDLQNGRVKSVVMNTKDQTLQVTPTAGNGPVYKVSYPDTTTTAQLIGQYNVQLVPKNPGGAWWGSLISLALPLIIVLGFWFFIMNQMQGGGSKVMSFGKSRAKRVSVDSPKVTFKDVAGIDETVEELEEIKEFLENPKKFQQLGARIPKGCSSVRRAPARHFWRGPWPARPGCRSSRSPARTSSRCSSGWAPAGCATCSPRPSRTRPASSSWTRSTPWVGIAAQAWAAGTTSASRPSTSS